jgi:hypothetical protein
MGSGAERHESEAESNRLMEREGALFRNGIGIGQKWPLVKWNTSVLLSM